MPLPCETILITAAIYSGTTHKLSIWGIFAVAAAGAIVADNIGFWSATKAVTAFSADTAATSERTKR